MFKTKDSVKGMDINKVAIVFLSLLVGLVSGVIVIFYRFILGWAEGFCFRVYDYIRGNPLKIFIWGILLTFIGIFIGKLIEKNKMISGSGIPQVKGILMGYFKNNWLGTLISKFIAGTLGIIGGLSLGREGPSIQLGATIGEGLSKKLKISKLEKKILIASGASAGLAAAFNAPLAGVLFVLEEVFKYFSPLLLLATMSASIVADYLSKQFFGTNPIFSFNTYEVPLNYYWLLLLLGCILGLAGVAYNKTLLFIQSRYKKLPAFKYNIKPLIPLGLAIVLGLTFPIVLGGGHAIIEHISIKTSIGLLLAILIVKFLFSLICFGSGIPGGIFFPLLIMGGVIGAIFSQIGIQLGQMDSNLFYSFIVIAMAGFFTAIVRAPITGIVLISEMTGSFQFLLPLTIVSLTAYVVADLLKCEPIYDSLLEGQLKDANLDVVSEEHNKKITIPLLVQHESSVIGEKIKDIPWPKRCLLISIKHNSQNIVPNGDTVIENGDELMVLTDINNEWYAREELYRLTRYEE